MKKGHVVIVCKNKAHHGKKMNLPDMEDKQEISEDGTVEVPESVAKLLVEKTDDWSYLDGEKPDSEEDDSDDDKVNEDNSGENSEEDSEDDSEDKELDKELTKALLKNFDEKQLRKIASSEAKLSKEVIGKAKTKASLAQMIVNKLSTEDKEQLLEQSKGE